MHQVPLPPLYVFIRNLLYSPAYNPSIVAWVDQSVGCFKVNVRCTVISVMTVLPIFFQKSSSRERLSRL